MTGVLARIRWCETHTMRMFTGRYCSAFWMPQYNIAEESDCVVVDAEVRRTEPCGTCGGRGCVLCGRTSIQSGHDCRIHGCYDPPATKISEQAAEQ